MKKSLSLLMVITLVFGLFANMASAAETPASAGAYLKDAGVIKGDANGDLMNDATWKRQDLTVLLSRLLGKEAAAQATAKSHTFTDVRGAYYDGFISWAKAEKYMEGNSATNFGFDALLTNQQFAAVVLRALGIDTSGDNYAKTPELAVKAGIVPAGTDFSAPAKRGETYVAIVAALNTVVGDTGKKLGAILKLKGFETVDLTSAAAVSQGSIKLTFSQDVKAPVLADISVTEKDNEYAIKVVDSVSVDKNVVFVKLVDSLAEDTKYVIKVANVKSAADETNALANGSAEFTYAAQAPASIVFGKTTYGNNDDVKVVVKDANGNDITANYASTDFTIETSDGNVVTSALVAKNTDVDGKDQYSVVNVKLTDTNFETGNTIITVKSTLKVVTSIGKITLDASLDKADSSLFVGGPAGQINAEVLDQDGAQYETTTSALADFSFRSLSPTIAVVDFASGVVTPVAAGNVSIVVSATKGGKTVSKAFAITVKADATAKTLKPSETSAKLVLGSGIDKTVTFEVLDQYGNAIDGLSASAFTVNINKDDVVDGLVKGTPSNLTANADSTKKFDLELALDAAAVKGSATVTVAYGSLAKVNIAVSVVEKGAFAGYVAVPGATKLDKNTDDTDSNYAGPDRQDIVVYQKDTNGNYIGTVTTDVTLEEASTDADSAVTFTGVTVTAANVGKENIVVKVNGVKIATIEFTVVNTASTLTTITQSKNAVSVTTSADDLEAKLFGTDANGGAFVGYNQYGTKVAFDVAADAKIISSNTVIVGHDLSTTVGKTGTVTLTIKLAGKFYTINVKVTD